MKTDGCLLGGFLCIMLIALIVVGAYFLVEKIDDMSARHEQAQTEQAWARAAEVDATERGLTERAAERNVHRETMFAMYVEALAAFAGGLTLTDLLSLGVLGLLAAVAGYAVGAWRAQG